MTVAVDRDVSYGTATGERLLLDVYRPQDRRALHPAIVFVHGGGWIGGDKWMYRRLATTLAEQGYVGFAIDYRLALRPEDRYPAALDDAQRSVRWIRAHAAQYDVDPHRIGAVGDSAGGYLVCLLGTRDTRQNLDRSLARYSSKVECVVDLYGPTDFTMAPGAALNNRAIGLLVNFMGKRPDEAPSLYRQASPASWVDHHSAPFLIFHGTSDPLVPVSQSQIFYQRLRRAGVPATLILMPGEGHGFRKPESYARMRPLILDFFNRYLHLG